MKFLIKEIAKQLREIASKIETGTCELTEEQALNLFAVIGTELLSKEQACSYLNVSRSIVHEAKHVQSNICRYYDVPEDGEDAAYLIGFIVQKMYNKFKFLLSAKK